MKKRFLAYLLIALAIIAGVVAVYWYRELRTLKNSSGILSQEQTNTIVAQVARVITLPQGETPTIATVTDISKLRGQEFFVNAKEGQLLLMYTKARRAYLYDPATSKIIQEGPIVFTDESGV